MIVRVKLIHTSYGNPQFAFYALSHNVLLNQYNFEKLH